MKSDFFEKNNDLFLKESTDGSLVKGIQTIDSLSTRGEKFTLTDSGPSEALYTRFGLSVTPILLNNYNTCNLEIDSIEFDALTDTQKDDICDSNNGYNYKSADYQVTPVPYNQVVCYDPNDQFQVFDDGFINECVAMLQSATVFGGHTVLNYSIRFEDISALEIQEIGSALESSSYTKEDCLNNGGLWKRTIQRRDSVDQGIFGSSEECTLETFISGAKRDNGPNIDIFVKEEDVENTTKVLELYNSAQP